GRYVDANPAATRLLGIGREEIVKHRIGDFSSGPEQNSVNDLLERLMRTGTLTGEWTVVRTDGSRRETEYRSIANILPGLHCIISHDITDRKAAEQSLRHLSSRLMQLQDEERSRLGRQLHDMTAQSLAAVRLYLVRVSRSGAMNDPVVREAIEESLALTEQSIAEIRTLSYLLHPPMIDEIGLLARLRWYVRGFTDRSGIATTLDAPDELDRLPRDVEATVFRIIQEALTNVQRHSGSKVARIVLEPHGDDLRVRIEDEGKGLPQELRSDPHAMRSAGVGLAGIEQRARELGGTMTVRSDDDGTRVEVTLPVAESEHAAITHPDRR
ncbi:MAG TPA: ATP-binding protein, partial [Thermoanaerobaculia bacterium]|nr:ATP-binding protein [Thermoanaerobaculia bacterium]